MGELTGLLSGSAGGVAIDHTTVTVNSAHLRQHSRDSGSTTTTTTTTPTEGDRLLPSSAGLTGSTGQTSSTCITGLTGCNSGSCVPLPSLSRATTEIAQLPNGHLVSGHYQHTSRTTFENSDKTVVSGEMRDSSGGPGNVPPGWSEVAKVKSTDPKHHVYSIVGEGCKTMKLEYHGASRTLTTGSGLSGEHQSSFSQLYQQDHEVGIQTVHFSTLTLTATYVYLLEYFMIVISVEIHTQSRFVLFLTHRGTVLHFPRLARFPVHSQCVLHCRLTSQSMPHMEAK